MAKGKLSNEERATKIKAAVLAAQAPSHQAFKFEKIIAEFAASGVLAESTKTPEARRLILAAAQMAAIWIYIKGVDQPARATEARRFLASLAKIEAIIKPLRNSDPEKLSFILIDRQADGHGPFALSEELDRIKLAARALINRLAKVAANVHTFSGRYNLPRFSSSRKDYFTSHFIDRMAGVWVRLGGSSLIGKTAGAHRAHFVTLLATAVDDLKIRQFVGPARRNDVWLADRVRKQLDISEMRRVKK